MQVREKAGDGFTRAPVPSEHDPYLEAPTWPLRGAVRFSDQGLLRKLWDSQNCVSVSRGPSHWQAMFGERVLRKGGLVIFLLRVL